jgi:hypothetical protein
MSEFADGTILKEISKINDAISKKVLMKVSLEKKLCMDMGENDSPEDI